MLRGRCRELVRQSRFGRHPSSRSALSIENTGRPATSESACSPSAGAYSRHRSATGAMASASAAPTKNPSPSTTSAGAASHASTNGGGVARVEVVEQAHRGECRVGEALGDRVALLGGRPGPFVGRDHVARAEEPIGALGRAAERAHGLFDDELRERVGVRRVGGVAFVDRHGCRAPVGRAVADDGRARGREHPPSARPRRGVEHGVHQRGVGHEDLALWRTERHGDAGEVHDGIGAQFVEERPGGGLVAQVGAALVDAGERCGGAIESGDAVAGCRELDGDDPPESARRAGDDDMHVLAPVRSRNRFLAESLGDCWVRGQLSHYTGEPVSHI